jgi:TRAP-type C4-dicarboxylate transport system permease small subunit
MLTKICDGYTKFLNVLLLTCGVALIIALTIQVMGRYVPFIPLWLWPQEVINWALIWTIFSGSIVALREKEHFTVDIFSIFLKDNRRCALTIFLDVLYYIVAFVIALVFSYYGYFFFRDWGLIQQSDITGINLGFLYFSVPLTGVSWILFLIESLIRDIKGGPQKETNQGGKLL